MNENDYQKMLVNLIIHNDQNLPESLNNLMLPVGQINNHKILEVYAIDYRLRTLSALRGAFEAVWMVLGDEVFDSLIFEFIKDYPSQTYDLNAYGDTLPAFLKTKHELIENVPFIIDLAHFELAFWKTFHAKNPDKITTHHLSQEKILHSTLEFGDEAQLLHFNHHVFPLFQFKSKTLDEYLKYFERESVFEDSYYLLFKQDFKVLCHELTLEQFHFFNYFFGKNEKKSLWDVINLMETITQEEMQDIFKLISCSLVNNIKEIR